METQPLLDRLATLFPSASKTTLREMVQHKRVRINGTLAKSVKHPIAATDKIEVGDTAALTVTPLAQGLRLLHFDSDILIVDKPAGLLTSTDSKEKRPTAWRILTEYYRNQNHKNEVHLIHRLDRDASGLLVFARTWNAYTSLKRQFFEHSITREYDIVVHGIPKPEKSRLEHLLLEDPYNGIVHTTENIKTGKLAILDYQVLNSDKTKNLAHIRCQLFTGRKHQIRVQLKAAGHPICGDPVYGTADEPPHRLALHATHLLLEHPASGKKVAFNSPPPGSFTHLFH